MSFRQDKRKTLRIKSSCFSFQWNLFVHSFLIIIINDTVRVKTNYLLNVYMTRHQIKIVHIRMCDTSIELGARWFSSSIRWANRYLLKQTSSMLIEHLFRFVNLIQWSMRSGRRKEGLLQTRFVQWQLNRSLDLFNLVS